MVAFTAPQHHICTRSLHYPRVQRLLCVSHGYTTYCSPYTPSAALVVVYDDHPNAQTLYEAHIKPKAPQFQNGRLQAQSNRITERTIWSYVIQIANAIKAVHDAGLAVRLIDPTKILVTGKNRSRRCHPSTGLFC